MVLKPFSEPFNLAEGMEVGRGDAFPSQTMEQVRKPELQWGSYGRFLLQSTKNGEQPEVRTATLDEGMIIATRGKRSFSN